MHSIALALESFMYFLNLNINAVLNKSANQCTMQLL